MGHRNNKIWREEAWAVPFFCPSQQILQRLGVCCPYRQWRKELNFPCPGAKAFRLGHASPLFWRQHLFGSHLTHSYYLVRSFDLLITSTHREIATISHTVIHCDKEIHNYSPYKLHHILTWLLSAWLFGTPFNLWIQHHRNSQWSRQRWLLPGRSEVLGGGATCWLLLGRPWAEHRRGCPCPAPAFLGARPYFWSCSWRSSVIHCHTAIQKGKMRRFADEESITVKAVGSQMRTSFTPEKAGGEVCASFLLSCCASCEQPMLSLLQLQKTFL